jgi:hypothetical protein
MRRTVAAAIATLLAALVWADEARIAVPDRLAPYVDAGVHAGLVVTVEAGRGTHTATVSRAVHALDGLPPFPFAGAAACPDATALAVPAGFHPPWGLEGWARGASSAYEVVQRVVTLVSQRIRLEDDDWGPQDALSVLRRRRARCSGRANLAVGLLRSLGLPARPVHGVLLGDRGPCWHRWGEVWLGAAGWVAFDPGASVGLVGVRYLPMRGAGEDASLVGVRLLRLDERGFRGLPRSAGMWILPERGATVRCRLPGPPERITAELDAPDGSRWVRGGVGEVAFPRMLPGRYRLRWRSAEDRAGSLELWLGDPREVTVDLGASGGGL